MRPISAALFLTVATGAMSCTVLDASAPGNLVPRTVDEDPTIPAASFAGSRFHLESFGDPGGPTIIFLHGGPGGDFRDNLRLKERYDGYALTDDHLVVFWDQRGSGLSRGPDCDVYTLDRFDQAWTRWSIGSRP